MNELYLPRQLRVFTQKCQWLARHLVLGELTFHLLLKCQFSSPIHINQSLLNLLCIPIHSTNQSTPIWLKPNARCLDQSLPNLPCIPIISINQRTPFGSGPMLTLSTPTSLANMTYSTSNPGTPTNYPKYLLYIGP